MLQFSVDRDIWSLEGFWRFLLGPARIALVDAPSVHLCRSDVLSPPLNVGRVCLMIHVFCFMLDSSVLSSIQLSNL